MGRADPCKAAAALGSGDGCVFVPKIHQGGLGAARASPPNGRLKAASGLSGRLPIRQITVGTERLQLRSEQALHGPRYWPVHADPPTTSRAGIPAGCVAPPSNTRGLHLTVHKSHGGDPARSVVAHVAGVAAARNVRRSTKRRAQIAPKSGQRRCRVERGECRRQTKSLHPGLAGSLTPNLCVPLPDLKQWRINEQFEEERGDDAAEERRSDALHYVSAGAR